MAANVLKFHNRNPYGADTKRQQLIVFAPDDYELGLLVRTLSPVALRVLVLMAGKLNAEGYAVAPLDEIARVLRTSRTYVNAGLLQLAQFRLITKKKRSEYWLQPSVFRPALIEIRR